MLDDSDYFSRSVDQAPSCLTTVPCPQLKLSAGPGRREAPESTGSPAAGAPGSHTASLSSRPGSIRRAAGLLGAGVLRDSGAPRRG